VPIEDVAEFEKQLLQLLHAKYPQALESIKAGKLTDDVTTALDSAATEVSARFSTK
jgi:F-type H+-transporting ATPase subunit alpha